MYSCNSCDPLSTSLPWLILLSWRFEHKASPWAATATGLSSRWTGPEKPTAIASCYKSLKIYSISRPSPHHDDPVLAMVFSQKIHRFLHFRWINFTFRVPRCVFLHVNVGKPPMQFVACFSLILFLTTNPRWWNFKYFFKCSPPTNWGKMMNPRLTRAHIFQMGKNLPTS